MVVFIVKERPPIWKRMAKFVFEGTVMFAWVLIMYMLWVLLFT